MQEAEQICLRPANCGLPIGLCLRVLATWRGGGCASCQHARRGSITPCKSPLHFTRRHLSSSHLHCWLLKIGLGRLLEAVLQLLALWRLSKGRCTHHRPDADILERILQLPRGNLTSSALVLCSRTPRMCRTKSLPAAAGASLKQIPSASPAISGEFVILRSWQRRRGVRLRL